MVGQITILLSGPDTCQGLFSAGLTTSIRRGYKVAMRLAEYLRRERLTHDAFAKAIGVANPTVVRRYAVCGRVPAPPVMVRIVKATKGRVRPDDFFGLPPARRRRRSPPNSN